MIVALRGTVNGTEPDLGNGSRKRTSEPRLLSIAFQLGECQAFDMMRSAVGMIGFLTALFVNPSVACSSSNGDGDQWTYGEKDMEQAVVGTYSGIVQRDGGSETVTLTITRAAITPASAAAELRPLCGSRTFFVKPAGACVSTSTMPVVADLTSTDTAIPAAHFTGTFTAFHTLDGNLELSIENSSLITANYTNGRFTDWKYGDANGSIGLDLERK